MKELIPGIPAFLDDIIRSLDFFAAEAVLIAGFLLAILSDLFVSRRVKELPFLITLGTLLVCAIICFGQLGMKSANIFGNMIVADHFSAVIRFLLSLVAALFAIFVRTNRSLQEHPKGTGDLYSILIAVVLGLNLMAMSRNLLMVYISVEMVSVGSYLLVGYQSKTNRDSEAAMKYALYGAVCSAFMLYGMSMIYALTGSLDILSEDYISGLIALPKVGWMIAMLFIWVGIGFKLSFVPFHLWVPDVYQGAPTPVTAFLSTAPKIAGFALLARLTASIQPLNFVVLNNDYELSNILAVFAVATMLVGNFGAIWQSNIKRMLAYSSIGHTGFMFMALYLLSESGTKALLFYMIIYAIMNMAVFFITDEIEERTGVSDVEGLKGIGGLMPVLMTCMVIVLVSLTGLPPTAGFTAKFLVFSSAVEAYTLTRSFVVLIMIVVAVLSTVVSLFYYFKIPLNAFLRRNPVQIEPGRPTAKMAVSMILTALLLLFIIFPSILDKIIS